MVDLDPFDLCLTSLPPLCKPTTGEPLSPVLPGGTEPNPPQTAPLPPDGAVGLQRTARTARLGGDFVHHV